MKAEQVAEILKTLRKGHSYLIKEKKPELSFELLRLLIKNKVESLCITRLHPKWVKRKYKIKASILWLSKKEYDYCTSPTDPGMLVSILEKFIKNTKNGVVFLEGLECLIINNSFPIILKVVEDINENIMESNCRLLLPIDPETLDEKDLALLERNLEPIEFEKGV
ncbi:MAG: DUF835 domain-containing protein [Candidatus Thermoplasmatota archaeon]|nr:DUF835 domain-containing protein [Candidatus Thermoplasmatota archaeon]